MKRWQKAVLGLAALIILLTLWLLDAFTAANAHRLWRILLILLAGMAVPVPLGAAAYAIHGTQERWFRYGVAGLLSAAAYPLLNLTLFLAGIAPGETYRFLPGMTIFLIGPPPEAARTAAGLTFLFILPTVVRALPIIALPVIYRYAPDGADRRRLLAIAAVPALIALFWLVTLAATLAGFCIPVCGVPG